MKRPRIPDNTDEIDARWFRRLIKYFGGDPSLIKDDCGWPDFACKYPWVEEKMKRFVETAKCGDIALFVWRLCYYKITKDYAWARKQIERGLGDVTIAAFCMLGYGYAEPKWALQIIWVLQMMQIPCAH